MNDPFILYAIARFADTSILLNLVRASRQFHALVADNAGVRYDLMDCYAVNGRVTCADHSILRHGKIESSFQTEYWRADQLHRDGDLPALQSSSVSLWLQNGQLHRDGDLPAYINRHTGHQAWYKHGNYHREGDQPALIRFDCDQFWYIDGVLHRDGDQPAVIRTNGTREWWIMGTRIKIKAPRKIGRKR